MPPAPCRVGGANLKGELGNGGNKNSATAMPVSKLSGGVRKLSGNSGLAGTHFCAVTAKDGVLCWGSNKYGELGTGGPERSIAVPTEVAGLPADSRINSVSTSDSSTCALSNAGEVYCWGNNSDAQLGVGNTPNSSKIPVRVSGLIAEAVAIASAA